MRRHPLIAYVGLSFGITWLGVLPLVLGAPRSSARHAIGALGPVAAAVIVTFVARGSSGLRDLWRASTRWRAPRGWLAITLGGPLVLFALAVLITRPDLSALSVWASNPVGLLAVVLVSAAYGFGEEPGWRGFALPRLQERHSALTATLIVAAIWAAWHAPFFVYRYPFQGIGAIAGFVLTLFAAAIWLTFLYNSTNGSVLAVALWHSIWNVLNLAVGVAAQQTVMVANVLMLVVGLAVVWLGGPRNLCWSPRQGGSGGARRKPPSQRVKPEHPSLGTR
jgi:membrane protease YdiL (CAAX protease family)